MPFGLCNAPATFERLMEQVLKGLIGRNCLVYLDDIFVFSQSLQEHMKSLEEVFERLRKARLYLNAKKCKLFAKRLRYLGHIVSGDGIETDPEKISAVKMWPKQANQHEIRSFLGLCTYYRRFVYRFCGHCCLSAPSD